MYIRYWRTPYTYRHVFKGYVTCSGRARKLKFSENFFIFSMFFTNSIILSVRFQNAPKRLKDTKTKIIPMNTNIIIPVIILTLALTTMVRLATLAMVRVRKHTKP